VDSFQMIALGLGGNLPSWKFGPPRATLEAALAALADRGVALVRRSRWYQTAPVPAGEQPWYTNGVALVHTRLTPADLLARLLDVEASFGRVRDRRWEARILDLDLLTYDNVITWPGSPLVTTAPPDLPHPRMHERAFVLAPLAEIAPSWRHPVFGRTAAEMLAALPPGQQVAPLDEPDEIPRGSVAGGPPVR
jgi:2-amino-4-hydroxy-6-hydroxymethyldihydropteridine diphosphokinase